MANRLKDQSNLYLLQHSDNPIDWFPWSSEAFEIARNSDKPIFLSIGYSSCYWCHVMESDSFESAAVAEILNRDFVAIKVDREERPDIDALYMDFVVALHGSGGWPLSLFLMPDGSPFWGGTFFRSEQFIKILSYISLLWSNERTRIVESAGSALAALSAPPERISETVDDREFVERQLTAVLSYVDEVNGGVGRAPKFPNISALRLLLRNGWRQGDSRLVGSATRWLNGMISGGIYDHVEGGIARYSTDARWEIPHFEKMLCDNALLCSALAEGYLITKDRVFKSGLETTLSFILNQMYLGGGLAFSSIDAGEVEKEGDYYGFTLDDLNAEFNSESMHLLNSTFVFFPEGNFERGLNILRLRTPDAWLLRDDPKFLDIISRLQKIRSNRSAPRLDEKGLVSWNGLLISALVDGYRALHKESYLSVALDIVSFIRKNMFSAGELKRRIYLNDIAVDGILEDYAFLAKGLIQLYGVTGSEILRDFARELLRSSIDRFWSSGEGIFKHAVGKDLAVVRSDLGDGASISPNSVMLEVLGYFCAFDGEGEYRSLVEQLSQRLKCFVEPDQLGFSSIANAIFDRSLQCAVTVSGREWDLVGVNAVINEEFHPGLIWSFSKSEQDRIFQLCCGESCQAPTRDLIELSQQIGEYERR